VLESLADAYLIEARSYGSYRYNFLMWLHAWRKARTVGHVPFAGRAVAAVKAH
jgi:hypothetical protein